MTIPLPEPTATTPRVLVVTGGHPFEAEPFFAIFDEIGLERWTRATRPTVGHDVVVFYDMPGLRFTGADPPVEFRQPTDDDVKVLDELRAAGTGLVFLHHAIAGWPSWDAYAELVGGRFHYRPATLRGVEYPDSGYVFDVEHTVTLIDPDHPVCEGLPDRFQLVDELYCFPVFEGDVMPLMRTSYPVDDASRFSSADLAVRGRFGSNEGWTHPPGSALVAWAKAAGGSPVVYLQFGDGPETYSDPNFRRALRNAIDWSAGQAARDWARTHDPSVRSRNPSG